MEYSGVYAIIPARSGSKGVIDKNIKFLSGHPLIAYSIRQAILTANIDRVIISTDSAQYAEISREYDAETPFLRPVELSRDDSTDYDFIKHLLNWFADNEKKLPRLLVHLRPTTPLRDIKIIEKAIETAKNSYVITSLRSVHKMSESAYKSFEIDGGFLKRLASDSLDLDAANNPRQQFPDTYQANGYVDVLFTEYILENKKIHGNKGLAFVTPFEQEIDTPEDFKQLEMYVKANPQITENLFKSI